ncbi:MAG: choice-of-anchor L domain-containing protein [Candidatus Competibacteraceae bacterium]|nr:choice-of-anchor L domain-containing protein [Candidatus Competibacteraceae bacterium]
MKKSLLFFSCLACTTLSFSQLQVNNTQTPNDLVQNILAGQGVQISNVLFNGAPGNTINPQIGSFNGATSNIGLPSGIIMCTGDIGVAVGPNNQDGATVGGGFFGASDPDLDILAGNNTNDKAVLEFDFIPAGNTVTFRYVFGSEEYNEYVCSGFNDVFGFFISGPGITGTFQLQAINIAIIPNTSTPVAINTINNGTPGAFGSAPTCAAIDPLWNTHTAYYFDNAGGTSVQFDGFTVVMEAVAQVQCNQTYHLKIAIADAGDTGLDSGVFLEAGSLQSDELQIAGITSSGDSLMIEGCNTAYWIFTRPNANDTAYIDIGVFGTATMGVDYSNLPSQIVMPPGVFSDTISISSIADFITEGTETITLAIYFSNACSGDSATATLYLQDYENLSAILMSDTVVCTQIGESALLYPLISGGAAPYSFVWNNLTDTTDTVTVSPPITTDFFVTIQDGCGYSTISDTITVTIQCPIIVPNVLSANSDGLNDVFFIPNIDQYPGNEVYVYNRWGWLVYHGSNYQNDWAPTNLVEGVYFYVVDNKITEPVNGTLHIFH